MRYGTDIWIAIGSQGHGAISTSRDAVVNALGDGVVATCHVREWTLAGALLTRRVLPVRFELVPGSYEVPTGRAVVSALRRDLARQ
jgi:hypothetical protein